MNIEYSSAQLNDLPDEILIYIFKKLTTAQVLYSLLGVNKRLNKIVNDSMFTNNLTLYWYPSNDSIDPLTNSILDRFCCEILPKIDHKIKWLTLDSLLIKRVLRSGNYPNLYGLSIYNIDMETVSDLFIDNIDFFHILKNQISSLIIGSETKHGYYNLDMTCVIFGNIFTNFQNLEYLKFEPSINCNEKIFYNHLVPSIFSSTLLKLNVNVTTIHGCLYLLDGRFNKLETLNVNIALPFSKSFFKKIYNKGSLPNLKSFSLICDWGIDFYDEILLPLLHRMSNLEMLTLCFGVCGRQTFIDGNNLMENIVSLMTKLNKLTFNIRSYISLNNQINFLSNKDIKNTFKNFRNNEIISYVNYFKEVKQGQCHIYSCPYTLKYYHSITNNFSGGLFKSVRQIELYDEYPFEHEFFIKIEKSFPLLEKLTLKNNKPQINKRYRILNKDNQTIISYPYLNDLSLYDAHYDYIEEFLIHTNISLTNYVCLRINYKSLKKVTNNFKRNETKINCNQVNCLYIFGQFKISQSMTNYFPHAYISRIY